MHRIVITRLPTKEPKATQKKGTEPPKKPAAKTPAKTPESSTLHFSPPDPDMITLRFEGPDWAARDTFTVPLSMLSGNSGRLLFKRTGIKGRSCSCHAAYSLQAYMGDRLIYDGMLEDDFYSDNSCTILIFIMLIKAASPVSIE